MNRLLFTFALVLCALVVCGRDRPPTGGATEVRLVNIGPSALESVVIHVTGATYPVARIAPGDSSTVATEPVGESSVYVTRSHRADSLQLDVYFEPGYGGRVRAVIEADSLLDVRHDRGLLF